MSAYGERDIRQIIYDELDYIAIKHFGREVYYLSDKEKIDLITEIMEVLDYKVNGFREDTTYVVESEE